jgi:DNA-binding protein HU-beta
MNKADIIDALTQEAQLTKVKAGEVIDIVLDTIVKSLKKGEAVTLVGFGTFDVSKRDARKGRNPRTGDAIKIKAKTVPKFRAGKALRESVAKVKPASKV